MRDKEEGRGDALWVEDGVPGAPAAGLTESCRPCICEEARGGRAGWGEKDSAVVGGRTAGAWMKKQIKFADDDLILDI